MQFDAMTNACMTLGNPGSYMAVDPAELDENSFVAVDPYNGFDIISGPFVEFLAHF